MKKLAFMLLLATAVSSQTFAQKDSTEKGKVGKAVNKAGNATAHVAVSGVAQIKDKKYKGKEGPNGEVIFIDKHSKYYYIDGRGKKTWIKKAEMRDKPKK